MSCVIDPGKKEGQIIAGLRKGGFIVDSTDAKIIRGY